MSTNNTLTNKQIIDAYESMVFIRKFEEKVAKLYSQKLIGGFCHLYIGQEAIATGISFVKKTSDTVITSYRDHGLMLALQSNPDAIMAELLGKETGCSKGKGGSMHMFDLEKGFYGGHGIVGAQVPLGTGLAFAHKYKETENISYTFLGDGAINQGQVYEAFNMASLWKLPVIYVIENNEYSMGTSVERACANKDLFNRGESFGIKGYKVDGMDIFSVVENFMKAEKHVRSGNGPIILEMVTYRYKGHSMSDPATYRTRQEVEEHKIQDPIIKLKNFILKNSISSQEDLQKIEKNIKQKVSASEKFAIESNFPDESELFKDIYSN